MSRLTTITHCYVEYIPKDLDEGVLYISLRYRTASHLCACGCRNTVVTPLNPAKWRLANHGKTVSLSPSIGLGTLPCRSHYWIRSSKIDWYPRMTDWQTERAQRRDHLASQIFTGERTLPPRALTEQEPGKTTGPGLWAILMAWWTAFWKKWR